MSKHVRYKIPYEVVRNIWEMQEKRDRVYQQDGPNLAGYVRVSKKMST